MTGWNYKQEHFTVKHFGVSPSCNIFVKINMLYGNTRNTILNSMFHKRRNPNVGYCYLQKKNVQINTQMIMKASGKILYVDLSKG